MLSLGLGVDTSVTHTYEFFYGIVPYNNTGGGRQIETFAFKSLYQLSRYDLGDIEFDLYLGWGGYHVTGLNYQTSRNGASPRNYYRLGSIRALFFYGTEVRYEKSALYFENGFNDIWLTNYFNNQESIDIKKFMYMGVGYKYLFK